IGEFYSRKDLSAWMKKTFAVEIEEENAKNEQFRHVAPPPGEAPVSTGRRSGAGVGKTGGGPGAAPAAAARAENSAEMGWDDEELETQIFDKAPDELTPPPPAAAKVAAGEDSGVDIASG